MVLLGPTGPRATDGDPVIDGAGDHAVAHHAANGAPAGGVGNDAMGFLAIVSCTIVALAIRRRSRAG